jgi:succinate dehydrogenase/fumarate reductase flavoprotein subunit
LRPNKETKKRVSRRDFIKTTGIGVGATILAGLDHKDTIAKSGLSVKKWDYEADVVIIGYGGAGVVAAITAHDAGAKVLVLEKSPSLASLGITKGKNPAQQISGGGGNSHICFGAFCTPIDAEGAAEYLYTACGGHDPGGSLTPMGVCKAWAEEAVKNKAWADEMGITYKEMGNVSEFPKLPGYSAMYFCEAKGAGQMWFKVLDDHVQKRGIKILFNTPGKELIQDPGTKAIIGVKAESGGRETAIKAGKAVILCTGGFEYNEKLKNRFFKCYPVKFRSWRYNTGDGVIMAQKVGADLWNMNNFCGGHGVWVSDDPAVGSGAMVGGNNYIWVNKFGGRFMNEPNFGPGPHKGWLQYTEFDLTNATYPLVPHYQIFDGPERQARSIEVQSTTGREILPPELGGTPATTMNQNDMIEKGWIKKGDTIEDLAEAIGAPMDAAVLKETVKTYNGYCATGTDAAFGRSSKTLAPIETPPFYALPMYPGFVSTLGGPVVNENQQVLDPDEKPIPGLYAAGSCGSVLTRVYSVVGGNLGGCMISGRISGRSVAAEKPRS